jgi:tape measure domain-containing protein
MAKDRPVGNMKFGIGVEGMDTTINTLDKLNSALKVSESAMKANVSAFDKASNSVEGLEQKQKDLVRTLDLQNQKVELLKKRRAEYIETYGAESKQVSKVSDDINKASAKYNAYNTQLSKTKQAYAIASSGADQYNKALKDNEAQMNREVKALKDSGDKLGAYKAQKKGLEKQEELTTKAIKAQTNVVDLLSKEFGENSKEVNEAKDRLEGYKRQQQLTAKQIEGTNKSIDESSNKFRGLNKELDNTEKSSEKAKRGLSTVTSGLGSMLGGIGKIVGNVGLGALLTVGNKAFNAVTSNIDGAIRRIDTLNNSTRAFENMGFEADQTAKAMKNISKAIEGLPTPLQDSVSNVQLLAASTGDLDKSVDIYKALNDAILGFGGDANMAQNAIVQLSQAFSNGKIDASTWNSMINSGLGPTLNALAKEMGMTAGELKEGLSSGSISVGEFQDALIKLDREGGGGLKSLDQIAKDSTKGISTSIANAKTAMVRGTAELIKSADEALKNMNLPSIGEWIANIGTNTENMMKKVAKAIPEVAKQLSWVGDIFNTVVGRWSEVLDEVMWTGKLLINTIMAIGDAIVNIWENGKIDIDQYRILNAIGMNTETIWLLEDTINNIKQKMETFGAYITGFWDLLTGDKATQLKGYSLLRSLGMSQEDIESFEKVKESLKTGFEALKKVISELADIALHALNEEFDLLYKFFTEEVGPTIIPMIDQFTGALDRITGAFDKTGGSADGFKTAISIMYDVIFNRLKGLWTIFQVTFTAIQITIETVVYVILGIWGAFARALTGDWEGAWNSIKRIFDNISNGIKESLKNTFLGDMINTIETWNAKTTEAFTSWISDISTKFGQWFSNMKQWFADLPKDLGDKFSAGGHWVSDAFKGVFNGALRAIGKPVNGIIKGASWVLEKLGAEPLEEWEVPQYATGTPNGGHPGGPMMVNDGRGAEAVITPNGQAFIPKGRNVVMNAPKGTHVLTAEETAYMTGNKAPKYRYKKGTNFFGNLWDNVKGFAGDVGSKLKNTIGDVWEFMSDPASLAKKVLGGLGVLDGLTKYPLEVGKGILSKATSALTDKITGLFSSGNLDTSIGTNGVYKYLADVAKSVMAKFPGFVATSGYRPGDPYSHGKRNAIDIALPGVTGGSPKYTEAANYAFEKFASKIGYVITNGKVRDRSGQSGTGIHDDWRPWSDGDHYDHVHLNGIANPTETQISGENLGGSGVERWRGVATQALRMTGQYSASNLNALLNQMRTESNGNPNAINLWDPNAMKGTPSKGLMQVIDPTFRENAMPGYNTNIYDPLSNILASIRYALRTYGSLTNAYRGVGYENGGVIKKQHLAMVGEGNKEEVVIPLTGQGMKRTRAMQLLAYANEKLNKQKQATVTAETPKNNDMATIVSLLQQQNELLMALLQKDTNVVLDGQKVNSKLEKIRATNEMNKNRDLGLIF